MIEKGSELKNVKQIGVKSHNCNYYTSLESVEIEK